MTTHPVNIAATDGHTNVLHTVAMKELELRKLAASNPGNTKTAIIAALRSTGLAGNVTNIERLQGLIAEVNKRRGCRYLNKVNARLSQPLASLPTPNGRPAIHLPSGLPAQRLLTLRKRVITTYAKRAFRHGAPGGTKFIIDFAITTRGVAYSVELGRNYDVYRGAYKGWAANADCHRIFVPIDWRLRVERRDLALLGGMLTLDALPMEAPPGIGLYAAVWARQGRGYDVTTERGYIAVCAGEHFHGATPDAAIAGLLRRCKMPRKSMASMTDLALSVDAFASKYQHCNIDVCFEDARFSGSCEYGIRSWCELVRIDVARAHVPIKELLDAFRRMPLIEVRRAVLYAVRRHRITASASAV